MRIPLLSLFSSSPFEGLQEHSEKVNDCALSFQQAIECFVAQKCTRFEDFRKEITRIESEADAIKRRIRGHSPKNMLMPVDKFQFFSYLREQDQVLDAVEDTLDWISYRPEPGIPPALEKEFLLLVDSVITPIEELSHMVTEARKYFSTFSEKQRKSVKEIIRNLRHQEHEADIAEDRMKRKVFQLNLDAVTVFHTVRLSEVIGSIADHAENAGDMMRAMLAR